ncbi:histidine kinase, partial [Streptomyces sp. NPDC018000]
MATRFGRFRNAPVRSLTGKYPQSLAGQVFALQVAVVVLLVTAAVLALVLQSQRDSNAEARHRSVAVAQTFAHAPGVLAALKTPDPSKVLQPLTEAGRKAVGVDFIVVTDTHGIRYTHPRPELIGKKVVATIGPALAGHVYVESVKDPLGHEVQATAPIFDHGHKVVGLVVAGMKVEKVTGAVSRQIPIILVAGAVALSMATA